MRIAPCASALSSLSPRFAGFNSHNYLRRPFVQHFHITPVQLSSRPCRGFPAASAQNSDAPANGFCSSASLFDFVLCKLGLQSNRHSKCHDDRLKSRLFFQKHAVRQELWVYGDAFLRFFGKPSRRCSLSSLKQSTKCNGLRSPCRSPSLASTEAVSCPEKRSPRLRAGQLVDG